MTLRDEEEEKEEEAHVGKDWQNLRLKQVNWFYNQLRNVDMNRLLLSNTEQRRTTSSKHLRAIKLFQLTCAFLSARLHLCSSLFHLCLRIKVLHYVMHIVTCHQGSLRENKLLFQRFLPHSCESKALQG